MLLVVWHSKTVTFIITLLASYRLEWTTLLLVCSDYIKRRTRTKLGERCFSHAGPSAGNSLPDSIKLITDTNRFENLLKTVSLTSRFDIC